MIKSNELNEISKQSTFNMKTFKHSFPQTSVHAGLHPTVQGFPPTFHTLSRSLGNWVGASAFTWIDM